MAVSDMYAVVNGRTLNVYNQQQFFENFQDLSTDDQAAVIVDAPNGDRVILPVRNGYKSMDKPGLYPVSGEQDNNYAFLSYPTEKDKENYTPKGASLVDFKDADGIQSLMEMTDKLRESTNDYLTCDCTSGNTYKAVMKDTDSPEMRGLKRCITEKHIEIDKYGDKFGANWANDKRKLYDDSITMFLLKRMCTNFDIDVDLVFKDRSPDVPNPMGKTITVNLVPGTSTEVIEEN